MGELLLWYAGLLWPEFVAIAGGIVALVLVFEVIATVKEWFS